MNKIIFGIILLELSFVNAFKYECIGDCDNALYTYNVSVEREYANLHKMYKNSSILFLPVFNTKNECIAFYKISSQNLTENEFNKGARFNKNMLKCISGCEFESFVSHATYVNKTFQKLHFKKDIEINGTRYNITNYQTYLNCLQESGSKLLSSCKIMYRLNTEKNISYNYIMSFIVLTKVLEILILFLYLSFLGVVIFVLIRLDRKTRDSLTNMPKKGTYKKDRKETPFDAETAFDILGKIDTSMLSDADKIKMGIMKKGEALPPKQRVQKEKKEDIVYESTHVFIKHTFKPVVHEIRSMKNRVEDLYYRKSSLHRLTNAIKKYHEKKNKVKKCSQSMNDVISKRSSLLRINSELKQKFDSEQTNSALDHQKKLMKELLKEIHQNSYLMLQTELKAKQDFNDVIGELKAISRKKAVEEMLKKRKESQEKLEIARIQSKDIQNEKIELRPRRKFLGLF